MVKRRNQKWRDMDKSGTNLSILIRQFEVHNKTEGKTEKTVTWYNESLGQFYDWLVEQGLPTTLKFMDEDVVRLFILELQQRPGIKGPKLSSHSVATKVVGLRAFFAWLARKGFTNEHLLEDVKPPSRDELIVEPLTQDEINKLYSTMNSNTALGSRNSAIVSIMLDSGLRVSEVAGLKEEDVHLDSRYEKVMGKGRKERMISFGVACQKSLLNYYHNFRSEPAHPGVDTFFLSIDGFPLTTSAVQSIIKRLARSSGVRRLYPHLMRHTYATMFLLSGGDVFLLQQNLGHTSLEMVSRYVHLASRIAAARSQSFSPLDRLNVKHGRRFSHTFKQSDSMNGHIYPNVGSRRKSKSRSRNRGA